MQHSESRKGLRAEPENMMADRRKDAARAGRIKRAGGRKEP